MARRHARSSIVTLAFLTGISLLPGGAGNVGKPTDTAGGGGTVVMTQSFDYIVNTTPGQSMTAIRDSLVAMIDASPSYVAASLVDPNDPGVASLTVTKTMGMEADHLKICSTDSGIDHVGISFAVGRFVATVNQVTAVAANGNYRIEVDASSGPDVDANIPTTVPPNNTPGGLNASICSALTGAGYICDLAAYPGSFMISKAGVQILAVRVTASDSAISTLCVDLTNDRNVATPTLSQYGMFVLVLLMTGAAIFVMRRKAAAVH